MPMAGVNKRQHYDVSFKRVCGDPGNKDLLYDPVCNKINHEECRTGRAWWSEDQGHIEVWPYQVPSVRPCPRRGYIKAFALCFRFWNCQKGDSCTYAHSIQEMISWNEGYSSQPDTSWPDLEIQPRRLESTTLATRPQHHTASYACSSTAPALIPVSIIMYVILIV